MNTDRNEILGKAFGEAPGAAREVRALPVANRK